MNVEFKVLFELVLSPSVPENLDYLEIGSRNNPSSSGAEFSSASVVPDPVSESSQETVWVQMWYFSRPSADPADDKLQKMPTM